MQLTERQHPSGQKYREGDCDKCGGPVTRFPGENDIQCPRCGTWYNCFGQRLRDDWMLNPSNYDDDIGDLEGFEISQLRQEMHDE